MNQFGRKFDLILTSEENGEGIELGDLSVVFSVTKTAGRELNRAKIEVYNLSLHTIARIAQELRRVDVIAGYEGAEGVIFAGNISNVFTRQEGPDRITEIFAIDGLRDLQNGIANASFAAGTSLRSVIETLAAGLDEVKIDPAAVPDLIIGPGNTVISTGLHEALDDIADSYGLEWMITDHELRIFGPIVNDGSEAISIDSETGLIGSPVVSRDAMEFTCLLNPALRPLGTVEVSSRTGPQVQASEQLLAAGNLTGVLFGLDGGQFTISEVVHVGETRGRTWYSRIRCHPFVGAQPNA